MSPGALLRMMLYRRFRSSEQDSEGDSRQGGHDRGERHGGGDESESLSGHANANNRDRDRYIEYGKQARGDLTPTIGRPAGSDGGESSTEAQALPKASHHGTSQEHDQRCGTDTSTNEPHTHDQY